MAGICGNGKHGAYSIVLSGSYRDDEDLGDVMYEYSFPICSCVSELSPTASILAQVVGSDYPTLTPKNMYVARILGVDLLRG